MGRKNSRKKVISPMGQHDMNDSQQAHRHSRKRSNKSKSPTNWIGRDFCQANVQAHREIRGNSTSPRAHAFHAIEDRHEHKRHTTEWDMARVAKWHESIRRQMQKVVECTHKGRNTTHLYPANTREVGPRSRGSKGVVWWWGENGVYFGVLAKTSFGENAFLGWYFAQKR